MNKKKIEQYLQDNNIEYERIYPTGKIKMKSGLITHFTKLKRLFEERVSEFVEEEFREEDAIIVPGDHEITFDFEGKYKIVQIDPENIE